jgi:hypothetical protein
MESSMLAIGSKDINMAKGFGSIREEKVIMVNGKTAKPME